MNDYDNKFDNVGDEHSSSWRWDDAVIALALVFVIFGCVVGWL